MTIQDTYEQFGGDYQTMYERIGMENLIERFLLMFPKDETMKQLDEAVEQQDVEQAFRAAHTMKGLSANLSMTGLTNASHELTEQLRSRSNPIDMNLYAAVKVEYDKVIAAIDRYCKEK